MRFARLVCTTAALVLAVTPVWAQTGDVPAGEARSVGAELTVSDIVWMAEEGVSEDIIRAKVRESGQVFHLSVDEILRLKKAGVPDAVVVSMLESGIQTRVYKAVNRLADALSGPREYKVLVPGDDDGNSTLEEEQLNALGKEGWRIVAVKSSGRIFLERVLPRKDHG